jgi:hypothetical protein
LSRKRTAVLLAIFAALAAILSACGGGGGGGSSEDPQKVIEQATFEGIKSGTVDLSLKIKSSGGEAGDVNVELSGPFQTTGKESLPELEMAIKASGEAEGQNLDFDGGLTVLNDRAFIAYKGKNYEVDPTTFGFIKSGFEEAQQEGAGESAGGEVTACQKAATNLDLGEFVDNLENEGGEEVEGVDTTKVSGDLNPKKAVDAIIKLAESPACSTEFESAGAALGQLEQLKEQSGELSEAIKKAHIDVYVGNDDHIVHKVAADMEIEAEGETGEVKLDFTLGKVNEKQSIKAPAGAEPIEKLFGEIGVNPLELLGEMQGGEGSEGLGGLLEGMDSGEASESAGEAANEALEELELPSTEESEEFTKCLEQSKSASDIQKCAALME